MNKIKPKFCIGQKGTSRVPPQNDAMQKVGLTPTSLVKSRGDLTSRPFGRPACLAGRVKEILSFWFEDVNDTTRIDKNVSPFKKWFLKDAKFDQMIRDKFEKDLHVAQEGAFQSWEASPQGSLALILLFDQFSRNIYRNSAQAFAYDHLALKLAQEMISKAGDKNLPLIYRVFVYMPLMHAEDLKVQELGVRCFEELISESKKRNVHNAPYFEYNLSYSRRHRDIIKQFGRFPHRNVLLKRSSTQEEINFLKNPNSSF